MKSIGREKQLVSSVTQPGGVRVRPDDKQLAELLAACQTLRVSNIGSLLVANLSQDHPFRKKAKTVITIQHLAKKNSQYQLFFKVHMDAIRDCPPPQDNQANYARLF
jgi:hypothetical protein